MSTFEVLGAVFLVACAFVTRRAFINTCEMWSVVERVDAYREATR